MQVECVGGLFSCLCCYDLCSRREDCIVRIPFAGVGSVSNGGNETHYGVDIERSVMMCFTVR